MTHCVRRAEDYYSFVFSFPRLEVLALINAAACLVGALAAALARPADAPAVALLIAYYSLLLTSAGPLSSELLSLRRSLGLATIVTLPSVATLLCAALALGPRAPTLGALLSSYAALYSLAHVALRSFATRAVLPALVPLAYAAPMALLAAAGALSPLPVVGVALGLVASEATLRLIDRGGFELMGGSGLGVFKALARLLLLGDGGEMEEALSSGPASEGEVSVAFVLFEGDRGGEYAMVLPRLHPGPLRSVGSSVFPNRVVESLGEAGIGALVLRRASTHSLDMVDGREVEELISEIRRSLLERRDLEPADVTPVLTAESENFRCVGQRFGRLVVVVASRKGGGMEDLPEGLEDEVSGLLGEGECWVALVDAHNSLAVSGDNLSLAEGTEMWEELAALAAGLAKRLLSVRGERVVEVGFHRTALDNSLELGRDGIAAITISVSGRAATYVVIDANNMVEGLRDALVRGLRAKGYSVAEVITTDNHELTGVVPRVKYYPLGSNLSEGEVLKLCEEAVAGSMRLEPARAWVGVISKRAKVLGDRGFRSVTEVVHYGARCAKALLAYTALAYAALLAATILA